MALNWTLNFIFDSLNMIPSMITWWILYREFRKSKYRHLYTFSLFFLAFAIMPLMGAVATLFLVIEIRMLQDFVAVIGSLLLILTFEQIARNTVRPWPFIAILCIEMLGIIFDPPVYAIVTRTVGTITSNTNISLGFTLGQIFMFLVVFYHMSRIFRKSSTAYKLKVVVIIIFFILLLIGITIVKNIPVYGVAFIYDFVTRILMGIIITRREYAPLWFTLTFTPYRLTVIDTKSGIPLFSHTWKSGRDMSDEDLLSGMFQGISQFVKEAMNRGDLEQIALSNAAVIVQQYLPCKIATVMIVSDYSYALKDSIGLFTAKFVEKYARELPSSGNITNLAPAEELVAKYFSFIPE
jgi:hypothetical protein